MSADRPTSGREFLVGDAANASSFRNNFVRTFKYTATSFVPKNLFEQFRRLANVYFLVISLLQVCTNLSPTNKYSTIVPLSGVLLLSLVKEGLEDLKRHKSDRVVNRSDKRVYRNGAWTSVRCEEIIVGDIVQVVEGDECPADIVLIGTSLPTGLCYIETANLDGETNLKIRKSLGVFQNAVDGDRLRAVNGHRVSCEHPNNQLYTFEGTVALPGASGMQTVNNDNVVLRGTVLRNTHLIVGIATYTGLDTKLMKNSNSTPSKRSQVDRLVNKAILIIFFALLVLCTVNTIASLVWKGSAMARGSYIPDMNEESFLDSVATWITALILYNNLVPISLYVSLEIVKWKQARGIESDPEMQWVTPTGSVLSAVAKTSNLNEDLGQIEYVFSDKTGTLTRNIMELKKFAIGGIVYGDKQGCSGSATPMSASKRDGFSRLLGLSVWFKDPAFTFRDPTLFQHVATMPALRQQIIEFFLCLALCHTVIPVPKDKEEAKSQSADASQQAGLPGGDIDDVTYQAASPDEAALVSAARCLGFKFVWRTTEEIAVSVFGDVEVYKVLATNEFTSSRKRMSVLLSRKDGSHVLFCKGADNVIMPVLGHRPGPAAMPVLKEREEKSEPKHMEKRSLVVQSIMSDEDSEDDSRFMEAYTGSPACSLEDHLHLFASEGLRTLVVTKREVSHAESAKWLRRFTDASNAIGKREDQLADAAAEIERDLTPLGISAIEDKLQDGVPETISSLKQAGCKVWMLTGDKEETAVNIGRSCTLISENMSLVFLNAPDREGFVQQLVKARAELRSRKLWQPGTVNDNLGVVIQGHCLAHVLDASDPTDTARKWFTDLFGDGESSTKIAPDSSTGYDREALESSLLELIQQCQAVIACRVSPLQKALVVRLVKTRSDVPPMTLAIGDGGNDVTMIQEAHVGIGVIGLEGMQAVQASDYAIAQFRFLRQLMFVHGRWNYQRVSLVILYSFYKNIALVMTLFYFEGFNGYSGTTLFESWIGAGWNVGWTFLPILVTGIMDTDISAHSVLRFPEVYKSGQTNSSFSSTKLVQWAAVGLLHSFIVYVTLHGLLLEPVADSNGMDGGLWMKGAIVNFCLVIVVNVKLAMSIYSFHLRTILLLLFSVFAWMGFVLAYSYAYSLTGIASFADFAGSGMHLFGQPMFWIVLPVTAAGALTIDIVAAGASRLWMLPSRPDTVVQEWDRGHNVEASVTLPTAQKSDAVMPAAAVLSHELGKINVSNVEMDPEEHASWCKQLKDLTTQIRKGLPSKENDSSADPHPSVAVKIARLTLRFIRQSGLDENFTNKWLIEKSIKLTKYSLTIVLLLAVAYMTIEAVHSVKPTVMAIRGTLVGLGALFLGFLHKNTSNKWFQPTICLVVFMGGLAKTVLIDQSGEFGQTLFQLGILLALRIQFTHVLALSVIDLVIFILYTKIENNSVTSGFFIYIVFVLVFAATGCYALQMAMRQDFLQDRKLTSEQKRAEATLATLMPAHILEEFKAKRQESLPSKSGKPSSEMPSVGRKEENVSVLFCDIMDFSTLAAEHSPQQLVRLLDCLYSMFDMLCKRHDVIKMETVGKTFMAAAGLNHTKGHAQALVSLGLDMIRCVKGIKNKAGEEALKIRVGVNSGSVVSGLVGQKKQQFCLFGDTVNTASRMQSQGEVGRVQMSLSCKEQLEEGRFLLEEHDILIKGKGRMKVYRVDDTAPGQSDHKAHSTVEERPASEISVGPPPEGLSKSVSKESIESVVEMKRFAYWFRDPGLEHTFSTQQEAKQQGNARSTFIVLVLFNVFRLTESVILFHGAIGAQELYIRVVVIATLLPIVTWTVGKQDVHTRRCLLLSAALFVSAACLIVSANTQMQLALDTIFSFALVSNGGSLPLVYGAATNLATFAFAEIFAFAVLGYSIWMESFWMVCGLIFIVFSCASTEYYVRRRFALQFMTQVETDFANSVLYKMLPVAIVDQLKEGGGVVSDYFEGVSILFCDIKGFTNISADIAPEEVVKLLNCLFSKLDVITDKYKCFKVQTIGDAYVIVSGLPYIDQAGEVDIANVGSQRRSLARAQSMKQSGEPPQGYQNSSSVIVGESTSTSNAVTMLCLAFEMLSNVATVMDPRTGKPIEMRIGIHTGNITAGVIGTMTLRYDIWGKDVLAANLMESNGVASRIKVSETTAKLLRQFKDIVLEASEPVQVDDVFADMQPRQNPGDHLSVWANDAAKKLFNKFGAPEDVLFSDLFQKINRRDKAQERAIVVTNRAVYNLKPSNLSSCKRRIPVDLIDAVTISLISDEFVLHIPEEYDYRLLGSRKTECIEALQRAHLSVCRARFVVHESTQILLKNVCHTKPMMKDKKHMVAAEPDPVDESLLAALQSSTVPPIPSVGVGEELRPIAEAEEESWDDESSDCESPV